MDYFVLGIITTLLIAFIVVAWRTGALKDACEDGIREMKENWRVWLFFVMIVVGIPTTLAVIFG